MFNLSTYKVDLKQNPFSYYLDKTIEYLAPQKQYITNIDNMLAGLTTIGGQMVGKTTITKSIISLCQEKLYKEGIDENQIIYIHSYATDLQAIEPMLKTLDLNKILYVFYVNDDAPSGKGSNARLSLTKKNIEVSQFYFVIRHKLADLGFSGQFTIAHLTQRFLSLDKNLKVGTKLKLFKDIPEDLGDREETKEYLGLAGYEQLKLVSRKIFAPNSLNEKIEGLESGVMKFIDFPSINVRIKKRNPKNELIIKTEITKDEKLEQILRETKLKPIIQSNRLIKCKVCGFIWKTPLPTGEMPRKCQRCQKNKLEEIIGQTEEIKTNE